MSFYFWPLNCLSYAELLFLTISLLFLNFPYAWWDDDDICFTNSLSRILIVLAHLNNSTQVDILHNWDTYADSVSISVCPLNNAISSGKTANTNCIVFGLTRPGIESTILYYRFVLWCAQCRYLCYIWSLFIHTFTIMLSVLRLKISDYPLVFQTFLKNQYEWIIEEQRSLCRHI